MAMGERERYPVSSLHDFMAQLREEFRRFRIVSIFSVAAYAIILFFVIRFTARVVSGERPLTAIRVVVDLSLVLISVAAIAFTMYSCYRQNAFFKKWGKMFEKLEKKEQELFEKAKGS